jgi:hypothetical protein
MGGPWEKFQNNSAPAAAPEGPWSKYAAAAPEAPAEAPAVTTNKIGAKPQPEGLAGKAEQWFSDLGEDIRKGGDRTIVGRGLQALGAQPTNNGQGQGAGDFMLSPLLGPARALEGSAQIGQKDKNWQGVKNVFGGTLDAAQIPASFIAPEAAPAAEAVADVTKAALKPTAKMADRVIETLSKTASKEGFAFEAKSVPEAFSSLTDQFISRAKAAYKALDTAVNGELQPVLDKISDTKKAAKVQSNLDPEKSGQLIKQVEELTARKTEIIARAAQNGMPDAEQVLKQADKDYSRGKALEALTKKAKGASGAAREGGKTNPSKFATVVDNVANQEKITRGLGGDALTELQQHAGKALKTKKLQKLTGAAVIGGAGLHKLYGAVTD